MFVDSRAILSNFFEEQCPWKPPSIPFGIDACTFSEIAGKTTRDYTALALSSGWTRTQTIFSVNITKVEPYSHRLGGRYDTKPLYKVKFFCKKKSYIIGFHCIRYWWVLFYNLQDLRVPQRTALPNKLHAYFVRVLCCHANQGFRHVHGCSNLHVHRKNRKMSRSHGIAGYKASERSQDAICQ